MPEPFGRSKMPRGWRLVGFAVGSWSFMAGPREQLADWDFKCSGNGGNRRGARVDAGPLSPGNGLSEQPAPVGDIGQAQATRLADALDALHRSCVNDSVTIVKSDDVHRGMGASPQR
jgi:hypothetical protein